MFLPRSWEELPGSCNHLVPPRVLRISCRRLSCPDMSRAVGEECPAHSATRYQSLVERHTLEQWEAQLEKLVQGLAACAADAMNAGLEVQSPVKEAINALQTSA